MPGKKLGYLEDEVRMIIIAGRLPWELSVQQTGASELANSNIIKFKSFMDLLETNQSLRLVSAGSGVQVIPTRPEILDAGIPKG